MILYRPYERNATIAHPCGYTKVASTWGAPARCVQSASVRSGGVELLRSGQLGGIDAHTAHAEAE